MYFFKFTSLSDFWPPIISIFSQPNPNVININNTNINTSTPNNMPTHIFRPYSGGQDNPSRMPPGSGPPGPGSGGGITMNGPSSEPKFENKVEPSDETLVPNEILDLFPNEPSTDTPTPKNEPVQCGMCQKQVRYQPGRRYVDP